MSIIPSKYSIVSKYAEAAISLEQHLRKEDYTVLHSLISSKLAMRCDTRSAEWNTTKVSCEKLSNWKDLLL